MSLDGCLGSSTRSNAVKNVGNAAVAEGPCLVLSPPSFCCWPYAQRRRSPVPVLDVRLCRLLHSPEGCCDKRNMTGIGLVEDGRQLAALQHAIPNHRDLEAHQDSPGIPELWGGEFETGMQERIHDIDEVAVPWHRPKDVAAPLRDKPDGWVRRHNPAPEVLSVIIGEQDAKATRPLFHLDRHGSTLLRSSRVSRAKVTWRTGMSPVVGRLCGMGAARGPNVRRLKLRNQRFESLDLAGVRRWILPELIEDVAVAVYSL